MWHYYLNLSFPRSGSWISTLIRACNLCRGLSKSIHRAVEEAEAARVVAIRATITFLSDVGPASTLGELDISVPLVCQCFLNCDPLSGIKLRQLHDDISGVVEKTG